MEMRKRTLSARGKVFENGLIISQCVIGVSFCPLRHRSSATTARASENQATHSPGSTTFLSPRRSKFSPKNSGGGEKQPMAGRSKPCCRAAHRALCSLALLCNRTEVSLVLLIVSASVESRGRVETVGYSQMFFPSVAASK